MKNLELTVILGRWLAVSLSVWLLACGADGYQDGHNEYSSDVVDDTSTSTRTSTGHYFMRSRPIVRRATATPRKARSTVLSPVPASFTTQAVNYFRPRMVPVRIWATRAQAELDSTVAHIKDSAGEVIKEELQEWENAQWPELVPFCGHWVKIDAKSVTCTAHNVTEQEELDSNNGEEHEPYIVDLAPLLFMTQLKEITLEGVGASDWNVLTALPALTGLHLSHCADNDEGCGGEPLCFGTFPEASVMAKLRALKSLSLALNWDEEMELAYNFKNLSQLESLSVHGKVEILGAEGLSSLKSINMNEGMIRSTQNNARLPKLERATFHNMGQSAARLALIATPALVHFQDESVDEVNLVTLAERAPNLKTLDISDSGVSQLSPLVPLQQLVQLNLNDTSVSSLAPLAKMHALQSLSIVLHSATKGEAAKALNLSGLSALKKLRELNLGGQKIHSLQPLRHLRLEHLVLEDASYGGMKKLSVVRRAVKSLAITIDVSDDDGLQNLPVFRQLHTLSIDYNSDSLSKRDERAIARIHTLKTLHIKGFNEMHMCPYEDIDDPEREESCSFYDHLTNKKKIEVEVENHTGCGC
jgi:Leucine-rich repeat (LRR) protein